MGFCNSRDHPPMPSRRSHHIIIGPCLTAHHTIGPCPRHTTPFIHPITPWPTSDAVLMFPSYHHRSLPYGTPHHRPLPPARQTIPSSHPATLRHCSGLVRLQCRPPISPSVCGRALISRNTWISFSREHSICMTRNNGFFLRHCVYSTNICVSGIYITSTRRPPYANDIVS